MHRDMNQPSLAETLVSAQLRQNQRLERIDRTVDRQTLRKLAEGLYSARGESRPAYPPLVKVLLEQSYNPLKPAVRSGIERPIGLPLFVVGISMDMQTPLPVQGQRGP